MKTTDIAELELGVKNRVRLDDELFDNGLSPRCRLGYLNNVKFNLLSQMLKTNLI